MAHYSPDMSPTAGDRDYPPSLTPVEFVSRPRWGPFSGRLDLPDAEIHLVPGGGHFLLESHLDTVAGYVRGFLTAAESPA
jgi:pimeloyl-ACP methyl ester carboxylesterase